MTRSTRFSLIYKLLHLWNPIENHEKRFGQASSGQATQCPGKEAIQPHQLCLREPRKGSAHWHAALQAVEGTTLIQKMKCLRHRSVFEKSSKFRQTVSHVCIFKMSLMFCNCCPKLTRFDEN